ncbi:hypothetical protein L195_g026549 [Trifolium pratense]|uniref:Uncharacterized protein n=1 Tax=Trifolium pratense TaxID=57577 RepID=A0A2K3NJL3_TRIPR|nr:hypothetical protein L195_g026549 [Trifolium pratense]
MVRRPFSSSFGRVTPNAKPGAGLAAAASRLVPTPHAAVIISRRRSYNLARIDSKGRELGEKIDNSVERKIERSVSVDDVEIGEIEVNADDVHVVSEEKPSQSI